MKTITLVQFISFNNARWWDFEDNKVLGWGIADRASFEIPDGYEVGTSNSGKVYLYDPEGDHCELYTKFRRDTRDCEGNFIHDHEGTVYADSFRFGSVKLNMIKKLD